MLWHRDTMVVTFRIDKQDWQRFLAALELDKYMLLKPTQQVRELVIRYTHAQELAAQELAAAPAPASSPAKKRRPAPKPKKAKSNRGR